MSTLNRLGNCHNKYQELLKYPRTLCVCSASLLRAPSIAFVVSNPPYNRNVRAAGIVAEYALIPVDQVLLEWADEIICAEKEHEIEINNMLHEYNMEGKTVYCLQIADEFPFRAPHLIDQIKYKLERVQFPKYEFHRG